MGRFAKEIGTVAVGIVRGGRVNLVECSASAGGLRNRIQNCCPLVSANQLNLDMAALVSFINYKYIKLFGDQCPNSFFSVSIMVAETQF